MQVAGGLTSGHLGLTGGSAWAGLTTGPMATIEETASFRQSVPEGSELVSGNIAQRGCGTNVQEGVFFLGHL